MSFCPRYSKLLEPGLRRIDERHIDQLRIPLQLGTITDELIDTVLGKTPDFNPHYVELENGLAFVELRGQEGSKFHGDDELFVKLVERRKYGRGGVETDWTPEYKLRVARGLLVYDWGDMLLPNDWWLTEVNYGSSTPRYSMMGHPNEHFISFRVFPDNIGELSPDTEEYTPRELLSDRNKYERALVDILISEETYRWYMYGGKLVTDGEGSNDPLDFLQHKMDYIFRQRQ